MCAIGHRLVQSGRSVLFIPAYRRCRTCSPPSATSTCRGCSRKLDNYDLLVIDDLGYLPQGAGESEVLFTLIAERYERRSLGITSNLVFSEWEKVFANPMATAAAIDRIVHHSVILEFNVPSYRTSAARNRQAVAPAKVIVARQNSCRVNYRVVVPTQCGINSQRRSQSGKIY